MIDCDEREEGKESETKTTHALLLQKEREREKEKEGGEEEELIAIQRDEIHTTGDFEGGLRMHLRFLRQIELRMYVLVLQCLFLSENTKKNIIQIYSLSLRVVSSTMVSHKFFLYLS